LHCCPLHCIICIVLGVQKITRILGRQVIFETQLLCTLLGQYGYNMARWKSWFTFLVSVWYLSGVNWSFFIGIQYSSSSLFYALVLELVIYFYFIAPHVFLDLILNSLLPWRACWLNATTRSYNLLCNKMLMQRLVFTYPGSCLLSLSSTTAN